MLLILGITERYPEEKLRNKGATISGQGNL
jgi:hypothetical protein